MGGVDFNVKGVDLGAKSIDFAHKHRPLAKGIDLNRYVSISIDLILIDRH